MNSNNNVDLHKSHIDSHLCNSQCISWTPILMGALVAISLGFLLNLLGLGIGLSVYPSGQDGQTTFAVGGFIGLIIFAIVGMFPAGYVAGALGRHCCLSRKTGELYGLAAWAVALIVGILLASSIGNFVSQSSYMVNRQAINLRVVDLQNDDTYREREGARNETVRPATTVQVDPDKAAQAVAMATFATFFISFMGLLAACLGGRCAMMCRKGLNDPNHCTVCSHHKVTA